MVFIPRRQLPSYARLSSHAYTWGDDVLIPFTSDKYSYTYTCSYTYTNLMAEGIPFFLTLKHIFLSKFKWFHEQTEPQFGKLALKLNFSHALPSEKYRHIQIIGKLVHFVFRYVEQCIVPCYLNTTFIKKTKG